jgi:uncharacterized protein (DUF427 family)
VKAIWNGATIADSDATVLVEGNHYFPPDSVNQAYLQPSLMRSLCMWKGVARYYSLEVGGARNVNAAWSYPRPWPWVRRIRGYVAFRNGVQVPLD